MDLYSLPGNLILAVVFLVKAHGKTRSIHQSLTARPVRFSVILDKYVNAIANYACFFTVSRNMADFKFTGLEMAELPQAYPQNLWTIMSD